VTRREVAVLAGSVGGALIAVGVLLALGMTRPADYAGVPIMLGALIAGWALLQERRRP
jgi:hypothetical protein